MMYSSIDSPQCVQGFLNDEAVKKAVNVYAPSNTYNIRSRVRQQRIIPGINFTCTGTLTKWIIGAKRKLAKANNPQHLQLQIWRQFSNTYNRIITFSNITALNVTGDLNVYEYIPNPPLQFQTNDFLGLYQPRLDNTEVEVYYQSGGGPRNFARYNQNSPVTGRFTTGGGVDNSLPLVTVEVNGNCTEGFITREQLADAALLIGDFAKRYHRQLIIPNMTFTSSGSVVSWTFAAQYNASATQYPELQVWRETTTGRYMKVGSTGDVEPIQTAYLNVYEYVLNPPLQVMGGDVLGIYQPAFRNNRVKLLFLSDSNHVNWYTGVSRPRDSFVATDSQTNNVLPLVAVSFVTEGKLYLYTELMVYISFSTKLCFGNHSFSWKQHWTSHIYHTSPPRYPTSSYLSLHLLLNSALGTMTSVRTSTRFSVLTTLPNPGFMHSCSYLYLYLCPSH